MIEHYDRAILSILSRIISNLQDPRPLARAIVDLETARAMRSGACMDDVDVQFMIMGKGGDA